MFRNQIDPLETGRPKYSETVDILLAAAETGIYGKSFEPVARKNWSENETVKDGRQGLSALMSDVRLAVKYLSGPDTLVLHDDIPDLVAAAFDVLDNVVNLYCYVDAMEPPDLPVDFYQQINTVYLELTNSEDDYTILPIHRFIPLNEWRLRCMAKIPEKFRYLFPWYDRWSLLPVETLSRLVSHWQDVMNGEDMAALEISETQAEALVGSIQRDIPFFSALKKQATLLENIADAVSSSPHLSLAAVANLVVPKGQLPDIVMEKGFQAVAGKALMTKFYSFSEKIDRLLLAAFFGPDLSDEERMTLLKEVGAWLRADAVGKTKLSRELRVWWNSFGRSAALMELAMVEWIQMLEMAALDVREPVAYCKGAFHEAVERLLKEQPVSWLDKISNVKEKLIRIIPSFNPVEVVEPVMDMIFKEGFPEQFALADAASESHECLVIHKRGEDLVDFDPITEINIGFHEGEGGNRIRITWSLEAKVIDREQEIEISCRWVDGDFSEKPVLVGRTAQRCFADFTHFLNRQTGSFRVVLIVEERES